MGEIDAGSPVAIIYPDRAPDEMGTLFIPNTLAIMKGAPHDQEAEALADYLLSPEVEALLARGPSAQIPLLENTNVEARVQTPRSVHAMSVDFEAAAKLWDKVAAFLAFQFAGQ
jgi:iron(III) transport system substrate-binding protein